MATMNVKDSSAAVVAVEKPNANGRAAAAASRPVALSTEDLAAVNAITTAVTSMNGSVDGLEASATALNGYVDGLETLIGTTNTTLATIVGHVDGLEGYTDGLETAIASTNTKLDTLAGHVDGLETLATALNGYTDGLETAIASTNTKLDALIAGVSGGEYETVTASATDQVLGATGAAGNRLSHLVIVPSSLSPGAVSIKDGSGGADITVFAGGASSLLTLHPFVVNLGMTALSTGWRVTTGAAVSVIAVGDFT